MDDDSDIDGSEHGGNAWIAFRGPGVEFPPPFPIGRHSLDSAGSGSGRSSSDFALADPMGTGAMRRSSYRDANDPYFKAPDEGGGGDAWLP